MVGEVVRAADVRPGDEVRVGALGLHVASSVDEYDAWGLDRRPCVVVTYFKRGETSFENKARDHSGRNERAFLVERSLAPCAPGDPVVVVRGAPERAEELRSQMAREQAERNASSAERMRRQAYASARAREGA